MDRHRGDGDDAAAATGTQQGQRQLDEVEEAANVSSYGGLVDRASIATNDAVVQQLMTDQGAAMIVLSAAKGRQFSLEDDRAKGGLFSVAVAEIVGSQRLQYDTDGDGVISISELYRALKAKVIEASKGGQTPWLSRNKMVGDFGIF